FGPVEIRDVLFPTHERRRLGQVPRTLSFVKQRDMLDWWSKISQTLIPKVVHVLNECSDFTPCLTDAHRPPCRSLIRDAVARQCLTQDRNKRTISGKKDAVQIVVHVTVLSCDIQSNQGLACSRDPGHETNRFQITLPRFANHFRDAIGCYRKISCRSVATRDLMNGMPLVQRHCGFNDRRCRAIPSPFPFDWIDRSFSLR